MSYRPSSIVRKAWVYLRRAVLVSVAAVEQQLNPTSGEVEVKLSQQSHRAGVWDAATFATQQWAETAPRRHSRGIPKAKRLACVADGAVWIWQLVPMYFSPALKSLPGGRRPTASAVHRASSRTNGRRAMTSSATPSFTSAAHPPSVPPVPSALVAPVRLTPRPPAHPQAIQQRRRTQNEPALPHADAARAGIEGTLSPTRRTPRLGRARVGGLANPRHNRYRLSDWLAHRPRALTRTSSFAHLALQP